ncbi:O-antigen ligase family protein [Acinetobacter sp. CUI P1]|nr:O-antigen ligase family protein [Acinetobacter sp. CUI P1]
MMTTYKLEKLPFYTLLIFIIAGSIGAGYFYTRSFLALSAVLYGVTVVYIYSAKKLKLLPIHGFLGVFILLYWIAVWSAVDHEQAVLEAIKVSLLLPVSLLFSSLSERRRDQIWATWAWSGAGLTLWGLVFGLFREGRLESTLGYANVFAVIVAAGMAAGWRTYMRSNQKRYVVLCLIQLCGLLLSGSRAVLILVVIGAIAYLFMNRNSKSILLVGGGVLTVLIVVIAAGVIMNSGGIVREITWNASEFELRRIYWSDAFQLWKEHWLAGIGGGGFAILYPSVYVNYVHQQFLQVALDAGVIGVLVFIAMIGSALQAATRQGREGIVVILALLLFCAHLAFDIDLAYPLVFGLFIMLLTSMEMEGYSGCDRTINKPVRVVMLSLGMIIVVICSWFTAGYIFKGLGEHATAQQDWEVGKRWLKKAQVSIPWSSEVHYKQAFLYSSWAQAEQNQYYMDKAIEEMRMAAEMVPLSREYSRMLKKVGE